MTKAEHMNKPIIPLRPVFLPNSPREVKKVFRLPGQHQAGVGTQCSQSIFEFFATFSYF